MRWSFFHCESLGFAALMETRSDPRRYYQTLLMETEKRGDVQKQVPEKLDRASGCFHEVT